jgi:hypothetical protein
MEGPTAESLALINMLTKISNSPVLLKAQADKARTTNSDTIRRPGIDEALNLLPKDSRLEDFSMSGGLRLLQPVPLSNLDIREASGIVEPPQSDQNGKSVAPAHNLILITI